MNSIIKASIEALAKIDNVSEQEIISLIKADCQHTKNKLFKLACMAAATA